MTTIQETLSELRKRLPPVKMTDEQLERTRRAAMARNSICSPDCPECGGVGYIRGDGGKVQLCPRVDPLSIYTVTRYGLTAQDLELTWPAGKMNDASKAVKAVQAALKRGSGWVFIWGPPGVAKTLVLKIAAAEYLRNRRQAAYTRMAEILDNLRQAIDAEKRGEDSISRLEWWSSLPLLAIDEFDRVNMTDYAKERIFLLMDRRYESACQGKTITLMASNNDPEKLDGYLADRIHDNRFSIAKLTGASARKVMEW